MATSFVSSGVSGAAGAGVEHRPSSGGLSARSGSSSSLRPNNSRSSLGRPASAASLMSARSASRSSLGRSPSVSRITGIPAAAVGMAGKPSNADSAPTSFYGNEEESTQFVSGITVVTTPSIGVGMSQNAALLSLYVMVATSAGRCIRVNVGKALGNPGNQPGKGDSLPLLTAHMATKFFYHVGTLHGLCVSNNSSDTLVATSGEDKRICVWDIHSKQLVARYIAKVAVNCIAFDNYNKFIAAGLSNGAVTLYAFLARAGGSSGASSTGQRVFGETAAARVMQSEFPFVLRELS